jgi:hypothetical protein
MYKPVFRLIAYSKGNLGQMLGGGGTRNPIKYASLY